MKTTFKQLNDAHALLKAITLIHSSGNIQDIYGEGLKVLYYALDEIEVENEIENEQETNQECRTAIDWFIEQLPMNIVNLYCDKSIINKAKSIQKVKIINAFEEGFTEGCRYTTDFEPTQWIDAEDYYNTIHKRKKMPININL